MANTFDVVVVGAGISGLVAANRIHKSGKSVIVLEANDRVGGRTHTSDFNGKSVDLGAAFVGPTQTHILSLMKELGISLRPTFDSGKSVIDQFGKLSSYTGTIPSLLPHCLIDLHMAITLVDKLAMHVSVTSPWESPGAKELDEMTVQEFLNKKMWTKEARMCFDAGLRTIFGCELSEISLLYGLWFIKCGGGVMPLVDVKNGAQQDQIVGGTQQISIKLAERLPKDSLVLSSPVRRIEQTSSDVTVISDKGTYKGKCVVVALAPSLCTRISFSPKLLSDREQLCQRVFMGYTVKTYMFYSRRFWAETGFNGSNVSDSGPVRVTYDVSEEGGAPAIMGFIVGSRSRAWLALPQEVRKLRIMEQYHRMFNSKEAFRPIGYMEKDWSEEEFTGGCPTSLMGPCTLTTCGPALRRPFGHVFWAGTETATAWTGYMSGAVQAGERAAEEALATWGFL
mmetsp:Transcript_16526/g.27316  ORF Transcript_16526/g.27316 Transcript_16526/m.27316 type:complete len:453 (-) Transcript_16526:192-1550(-)